MTRIPLPTPIQRDLDGPDAAWLNWLLMSLGWPLPPNVRLSQFHFYEGLDPGHGREVWQGVLEIITAEPVNPIALPSDASPPFYEWMNADGSIHRAPVLMFRAQPKAGDPPTLQPVWVEFDFTPDGRRSELFSGFEHIQSKTEYNAATEIAWKTREALRHYSELSKRGRKPGLAKVLRHVTAEQMCGYYRDLASDLYEKGERHAPTKLDLCDRLGAEIGVAVSESTLDRRFEQLNLSWPPV